MTEVEPEKKERKMRTLAPEQEIYIVGKGWMKVEAYAPVVVPGKTAQAHDAFLKEIISKIVSEGPQTRKIFKELASTVAEKAGLKRKVGFTKYINDGTFGRLPGTLLYGVTRKAEKMYPDLFPEVVETAEAPEVVETAEVAEVEVEEEEAETLTSEL
jgi:hypothetical protein